MRRLVMVFLVFTALWPAFLHAEITFREGVTPVTRLPPVQITKTLVRLDVPQISQGRAPLCVPTSAAMVLAYYGERHGKWALKKLAEAHKPKAKRNADFTYYADMQEGLRRIGKSWKIKTYAGTRAGFQQGLNDIRRSLRKGRPVMIDVHLGVGHSFVVTGFEEAKQRVFIRDPLLGKTRMRVLSYTRLFESWHNHRFGPGRVAMFSSP